jgi:hypothetical protein
LSERALAAAYAGHADETAAALPQRLLNIVLFVAVLTSSIAFIEPSPHDGLMIILLATCVAARVRFDRKLVPLTLLLAIWLAGAFFALIPVLDQKQTVQYVATSAYLVIAAIMFACLFCDGDLVRLLIVRRAYIVAALIATAAGYVGFFHLLPGSDIFLANDRVSATFKDPNVYGPFLIFPLLLLLIDFMTRGLRLTGLAIMIFLIGGLLLSFSRGAWAHFAISAAVTVALLLAAATEPRMRARILLFSVAALIGMALFVVALISIPAVHDMFLERAKAIQPYDIGPGGRFWEQRLALGVILENPNGLGPFAPLWNAATRRLYAGVPGLWLDRRRRLSGAGGGDASHRLSRGAGAGAMAGVFDRRLRRVRRRSHRRLHRRYRPLAPFLSCPRPGLGADRGKHQLAA